MSHWAAAAFYLLCFTPVFAQVSLQIENRAGMTDREARDATKQVVRLLNHAGISSEWRFCGGATTCDETPTSLRVIFMKEIVGNDAKGRRVRLFGVTDLHGEVGPTLASYVAVQTIASDEVMRDIIPGRLLAYVIVHEIAHQLLGPDPHAAAGILRQSWRPSEIANIREMDLEFNALEKKRLLEAVGQRVMLARSRAVVVTAAKIP